jgi:hypothetical protein
VDSQFPVLVIVLGIHSQGHSKRATASRGSLWFSLFCHRGALSPATVKAR